MRYISILFLAFFFTHCTFAQDKSGKAIERNFYFLEDSDAQWCAYSNELGWRSDVDSKRALIVARLEYADGRMANVYVTEQGETGDWAVYDIYSLDENGALQNLRRTLNVIPGDRSELQIWRIQNGKAIKQSSISRSLSTLKPVPSTQIILPNTPIVTELSLFPFWPLIRDSSREIGSKGKVCIPRKF